MKTITVDGDKFSDLEGFYREVKDKLTKDISWEIRNLDSFNDILRGGFCVHEYGEPICVIWKNAAKSRSDLSYRATLKCYKSMRRRAHPSNRDYIKTLINEARAKTGPTLYDTIVSIIRDHEHIAFVEK